MLFLIEELVAAKTIGNKEKYLKLAFQVGILEAKLDKTDDVILEFQKAFIMPAIPEARIKKQKLDGFKTINDIKAY